MKDKFLELSEEKKQKMINAAMEVFGKYKYRHASCNEIAAKAGISKGLLFYYFDNKKSLYLYTYQFCLDLMIRFSSQKDLLLCDDFFDILEYGIQKKAELMYHYPFLMEFSMRAYYSQGEEVDQEVTQDIMSKMPALYELYFSHVKMEKFKAGIDPFYILQMMVWMSDGYLHTKEIMQEPMDIDEMMMEFHKWEELFLPMVYKEEYL